MALFLNYVCVLLVILRQDDRTTVKKRSIHKFTVWLQMCAVYVWLINDIIVTSEYTYVYFGV